MGRIVAVLFLGFCFQVMASSITKIEAERVTPLTKYSLTVYKKRVRNYFFRFEYRYELTAISEDKKPVLRNKGWIQGYRGVFWDENVKNWPHREMPVDITFRVDERAKKIFVEYKDGYGLVASIRFDIKSIHTQDSCVELVQVGEK